MMGDCFIYLFRYRGYFSDINSIELDPEVDPHTQCTFTLNLTSYICMYVYMYYNEKINRCHRISLALQTIIPSWIDLGTGKSFSKGSKLGPTHTKQTQLFTIPVHFTLLDEIQCS